jgi:hypothetical protein
MKPAPVTGSPLARDTTSHRLDASTMKKLQNWLDPTQILLMPLNPKAMML